MARKIVEAKSKISKELRRKKLYALILLWGSLLLIIFVFSLMSLFGVDENTTLSVLLGLSVFALVVLFKLKPRISFYAMHYNYQMLLDYSEKECKTNCNFDNSWLKKIEGKGFISFFQGEFFAIYYRISKQLEKQLIKGGSILEIISIIKDNNLDFYADELEAEYKKIWLNFHKENRLTKQVIIQFKKYQNATTEAKEELDKIICYREGKSYLITINAGYFAENKTIYYLHSDTFSPNRYYYYGVNLLKEIC